MLADTDHDLLRKFRGGETRAFEIFFNRYFGRLAAHLQTRYRLTYDRAQDLAIESLTKILQAEGGTSVLNSPGHWLYAVARNAALDEKRSTSRSARQLPVFGTSQAAGTSDLVLAVRQCLRRLSAADQELIRLRYFEGLSVEETAAELRIKGGTVRSRMHAAIRRLRQQNLGQYTQTPI